MRSDLRYAFRVLSRAPGFTFAVVSVLALGIGANSAIFSALDQIVIRPLPYADPDRLVTLWEDFSSFGVAKSRVSPATFLDWRRRSGDRNLIGRPILMNGRNYTVAGVMPRGFQFPDRQTEFWVPIGM